MGFWVFMLIMDLLIPVTMIVFGWKFLKKPPKEINPAFGYRTAMSMKNKDTWDYAHHYIGSQWVLIGWILLIISVVLMLFFIGKDDDAVGLIGGCLEAAQIIPMIGTVMATERELKRVFDEEGKRRG